jgi:hypothetical protein
MRSSFSGAPQVRTLRARSNVPLVRRPLVALAVASAITGASTLAHANGRFPAANQLVIAPDDPSTIFVRATFGVLVTTDAGKDWDWICEQAIGLGPTTTVDPSIGITATTNVIASTFTSLFMSPDRGCTWNPATAFAHTLTQDVAVRADDPHIALALTNGYVSQSDAGVPLYSSQIFTTTDDGVTWASAVPPIDPTLVLETLDVAASDPMRIYVSGIRGVGASTVGVLLESRDQGMTFTEHDIPLDLTNEIAPYIAAIDPTNADHVYVRTSPTQTMNPTRVILFDASQASDASTGLTTLLTMGDPTLGFAITPDGSKIYAGSLAGGLLVASTSDNMFHQTSTIRVRCLRSTGATLYACSDEVSGFIVGSSTDDGASFTPLLHLSTIRGALDCPASSTVSTSMCSDMWPAQQEQLGVTPDSGTMTDDGGDGGSTAPSSSSKSCGCRAVSDVGASAGLGAALVGALGLALRRRSRHAAPGRRKNRR